MQREYPSLHSCLFPIHGLSPIGSHCIPMGLNPCPLLFFKELKGVLSPKPHDRLSIIWIVIKNSDYHFEISCVSFCFVFLRSSKPFCKAIFLFVFNAVIHPSHILKGGRNILGGYERKTHAKFR